MFYACIEIFATHPDHRGRDFVVADFAIVLDVVEIRTKLSDVEALGIELLKVGVQVSNRYGLTK